MPYSTQKLANLRAFRKEIESPRADGSTSNAPLLIALETTTRCNFMCVHCARSSNAIAPADMSSELFLHVVPLVPAAIDLYLFGDGEVLLDIPRHLAMIARIHQQDPGCTLGFSTNGKLLTPEVYNLYATAGVQYIQVSVDAATKELYEAMRRGGSFHQLTENLDGILALRFQSRTKQPKLHLATVISQQNYRQLPLLAEFAQKYDFTEWYINAEYPVNPGRDQLMLTAHDRTELERIRADITRKFGSSIHILFDPSVGLPPRTADQWLQSESPVFCTIPWQHFELKANGDVKICPYYHEPVCSMNGRSFEEVWNGEEFRRVRRAFRTGTDLPSYCVNCKLGMRSQYAPGYPGLPDAHEPPAWLTRTARAARTIRTYLF